MLPGILVNKGFQYFTFSKTAKYFQKVVSSCGVLFVN